MADYDDAESPIGERDAPSRAPGRSAGPIGKAWGWFNGQPAQTKVIVIGVIVVLGVIVWMALRKKDTASTTDETGADILSGRFRPLGASRFGPGGQAAAPTALPPPTNGTASGSTDQPAATAPPVTSPIAPTGGTPRPAITATATVTPTPLVQAPVIAPAAIRPPNIYPVTPEGMSPTMRGTDVPLSGTTTPINLTKVAPIGYTKKGPTPQTTRPTVISAVPTQRGTNISF